MPFQCCLRHPVIRVEGALYHAAGDNRLCTTAVLLPCLLLWFTSCWNRLMRSAGKPCVIIGLGNRLFALHSARLKASSAAAATATAAAIRAFLYMLFQCRLRHPVTRVEGTLYHATHCLCTAVLLPFTSCWDRLMHSAEMRLWFWAAIVPPTCPQGVLDRDLLLALQ